MAYFAKQHKPALGDPKPEKKEKAKQKPLKRVSEKRKLENAKYKIVRKAYLIAHPYCEVKLNGCTKISTEIHHDQGRGIRLNDIATFVAICRNCHNIVEDKNMKVK